MLFKNIPPQVGHATTLSCAGVLKCSHNLRFLLSTPKQSKTNKQEKKSAHEYCSLSYAETEKAIAYLCLTVIFQETHKKAASREKKIRLVLLQTSHDIKPTNIHAKARLFVTNQNSSRHVGHVFLL